MPPLLPWQHDRWSPLLAAEEADPAGRRFVVQATVWRWKGNGGWHFVTLPVQQAAEIKQRFAGVAKGWGSIKVQVQIGNSGWATSLFPAKTEQSYLFAVKASVRKAEGIAEGDAITATLDIV